MFEIEEMRAKALADAAAQRERLEQERLRQASELGGERAKVAAERSEHLSEIRRVKAEIDSLQTRLIENSSCCRKPASTNISTHWPTRCRTKPRC